MSLRKEKWSTSQRRAVWLSVWQRDGGLCVGCLIEGRKTPAVEIHHIVHRGQAPDGFIWRPENMVCLCRACHERANGRAEQYRNYLRERYGYHYDDGE